MRAAIKACEDAQAKKSLGRVRPVPALQSRFSAKSLSAFTTDRSADVHTLQANDYRGGIWTKPRQPEWTDMHWQMRNWYYFTWLSGDFNVEQHVHYLDVCAWVKDAYPTSAVGIGGRQVRVGEEYGNIFDHHSVVYEFEDGAKLFSNTRQIRGCYGDMSAPSRRLAGQRQYQRTHQTRRNSHQQWRR